MSSDPPATVCLLVPALVFILERVAGNAVSYSVGANTFLRTQLLETRRAPLRVSRRGHFLMISFRSHLPREETERV